MNPAAPTEPRVLDAVAYAERSAGQPYAAIARQLGVSRSTVRRAIRREAMRRFDAGERTRPSPSRGAR